MIAPLRRAATIVVLTAACRLDAAPPAPRAPSVTSPAPVASGPVAVWTTARAADPELVHLHIQAAATPGAFLVPWIEGVTLRPCGLRVHDRDVLVQRARLRYDGTGQLVALRADGPEGTRQELLQRDGSGRLQRARGFAYEFVGTRLQRLAQDGARRHSLQYDADGRLVAVHTEFGDRPLGAIALRYDEDRLVERRARGVEGEHSETYFTHDALGRLVRVDVQSTDASGVQRVHPSLVLEYEGDRLVQFGGATIDYDDRGRARSIIATDGIRTDYDYDCAP